MDSLIRYLAPSGPCGYLPDQIWRLEFEHFLSLTPAEYMDRLVHGWRRFGKVLFRPRCRTCSACQSLRVVVDSFRPERSQRRVQRLNEEAVKLRIGRPKVTPEKLGLYDRYHAHQTLRKGWPEQPAKNAESYASSFIDNPFPTEEWCYYLDGKLVGVGYQDVLPEGLSAIYFYYEPGLRKRSLGTWNILRTIEEAALRGLPHVYLGYYVAGSASMTYKSRFVPNQVLRPGGSWHDFIDEHGVAH